MLPVSCCFLAAIITPSGDAFTLFVVALPLYLLYEVSILVSFTKAERDEKVAA
jgi:sec-independent protein translocase protein TatC